MGRLTKKQVIEQTDGGLTVFQILLPELDMVGGNNRYNIDSPISNGKKCLSVFRHHSQVYYFKDHYSKQYGDIFYFVALLNKLNSKSDFKRVLEIIGEILTGCYYQVPNEHLKSYLNTENDEELLLVDAIQSTRFINSHFRKAMPNLEASPCYKMHLVNAFKVTDNAGETVEWKFEYSKPHDAFYALEIECGQLYVLFNPKTMRFYQWGKPLEFHLIGMEHLFNIAYFKNVLLRDTIALTNSAEGLLYLQDKGIPCVALLQGETKLPAYFEKEVLPLFPKKYLVIDLLPKGQAQLQSFTKDYGFQHVKIPEGYTGFFFKKNENAVDHILANFEIADEYEYEAMANPIITI